MRCLCLCHDVVNIEENGKVFLSGASQDEVEFLEMCKKVGKVTFKDRSSDQIYIQVGDLEEQYQILKVNDFTSARKRMSVVLKKGNKIYSFVKGADTIIMDRLSPDYDENVITNMDKLASKGLRTLLFAMKEMESLEEDPETDLTLLGATGLEDVL